MALSAEQVAVFLKESGIAQQMVDALNKQNRSSCTVADYEFGVAKLQKCTLVCLRNIRGTWSAFNVKKGYIGEAKLTKEQKAVIKRIVSEGVLLTFSLATSKELNDCCR